MPAARIVFRAGAVSAVLAGTAGCGDERVLPARDMIVDQAVTVVSTGSELLASPADLLLDPAGHLLVLDAATGRVLVVTREGTLVRAFGREGEGPGELRFPTRFALSGDTLRVIDVGNLRVQLFGLSGAFLGTAPVPGRVRSGPHAVRADGSVAVGTRGFDTAIVQVFDPHGALRASYRNPIAPLHLRVDFREVKNAIVSGAIPDQIRNIAVPAFAADGGVWAAFAADPVIRRYDSAGRTVMDATLEDPGLQAIRDLFFEQNRREPQPNQYIALTYVVHAVEIAGRLWALLNLPDALASVVLIVDRDGSLAHRVTFSGVRGATTFLVDSARAEIYFAIREEASVVRAPLPEALLTP